MPAFLSNAVSSHQLYYFFIPVSSALTTTSISWQGVLWIRLSGNSLLLPSSMLMWLLSELLRVVSSLPSEGGSPDELCCVCQV